jgi:hypothetical protein
LDTTTVRDQAHSLLLFDPADETDLDKEEVPELGPELETPIKKAGYTDPLNRLLETGVGGTGADGADFDHAVTHNGGAAYIYLLNRASNLPNADAWNLAPRFSEDVLAVAEEFRKANADSESKLFGKIEVILVRDSEGTEKLAAPYKVYVGGATPLKSLEEGLAEGDLFYPPLDRLKDFSSSRTGDIILIAKNDLADVQKRYYFSRAHVGNHGWMTRVTGQNLFLFGVPSLDTPQAIQGKRAELEKAVTDTVPDKPLISDVMKVVRKALGF